MDVISGKMASSTLNPYAPPFVPGAYRAVEDFSPEWWQMVEESVCFRDYWLRECFQEEPTLPPLDDDDLPAALPDADFLFHSYPPQQEAEAEEERMGKGKAGELAAWGAEKWCSPRGRSDGPRFFDKAPKIVSVKLSPRTIQQPR